MANQWLRLYAEFATDPKVQMMTEAMQRRYIMLFCMRCSNSLVTLHDEEVAFQLRISAEELAETKALFIKKGFIDSAWDLPNWEKRQFASDTSAARVAKHRSLQKEKQETKCNDDVTLQKQKCNVLEQNRTDTEQNRLEKKHPSRFDDFWNAWPKSERKQDKAKCAEKWKSQKLDRMADIILADIATKKLTQKWQGGFIEAPEVYLNNKRWEDGVTPDAPQSINTTTVPSRQGIDPTLAGLIKESISGAVKPPSAEIRARMAQLSGAKA